ncbi:MAG: HD domain-containing protein [Planctomycetota bacterium]|nr:HD domain-containing protein [Planctomycetota bacterium]MDE2216543.1 HD domain-containing protein [Planctomycetota bacterium]
MRSSIIVKIFFSFVLVSLLPIAALIAYNDWASRKIVYNMQIEEIKNQAGKLAKNIDRELSLKKEKLVSLSDNCTRIINRKAASATSPSIKSRLKIFIKRLSYPESVFILDTKGDIVVTNVDDIQIGNYAGRNFFKEAIKGDVYVSEPVREQGKEYMYYSAPVRNYKKEIVGILVMRSQAEELWKLIEDEKDYLGKGSLCILTDGYGVRIAHATNRNLIFKSWVMLDPQVKKNLEMERHYGEDITEIGFTEIPAVSKALAQSGGLYFIHPLVVNAENNHGYCISLKEKDWKLIYTVPETVFLAQVKHLTQNAMFSTGIVFVVVIAITWLLSVSLLRPIKRLTHAANEIANGNLDHPITNGSQDEIGRLMQSFEVMRNKLKTSYKELKDANIEAILTLARACEVRDEDTGNHVLRINHYSMALAKELGMEESFIKELGISSILHDVGKIHIPDCILGKQGSFTDEERNEMKEHSLHGDRILGNSEFFHLAKEIARWHHENFDGTGYPDGLKGEAIPICARIVRLADTYDALVTKRPYKQPWTDQKAYDEIVNHSGAYFDPAVVEAFKRLVEKGVFQKIKNKYA